LAAAVAGPGDADPVAKLVAAKIAAPEAADPATALNIRQAPLLPT
jgi:hypothetical protein